jgi:hypothetical protein
MTIKNVFTILRNLPTIWKVADMGIRFACDVKEAIESFPDLLSELETKLWVQKNADLLFNYASQTDFTQLDDKFAGIIRTIVTKYWEAVWYCIQQIQMGVDPDTMVTATKVQTIYYGSADEKSMGNPFVILTCISLVVNGVRLLKILKDENVEIVPEPVQPPKTRGKIRKALRKLFSQDE